MTFANIYPTAKTSFFYHETILVQIAQTTYPKSEYDKTSSLCEFAGDLVDSLYGCKRLLTSRSEVS